jgi:hypothetical protein
MDLDFAPGYPIDRRPEEFRKRAAEGLMGDFEGIAGRVLARLTGERVIIQDDGSQPAMPDIRVEYAKKPAAYVEVVVDIDPNYAAMDVEITKGARLLPSDRIWWVRLSGRANLRRLRHTLPTLLESSLPGQARMEQLTKIGVVKVDGPTAPRPGETGGIHLVRTGVTGSAVPAWSSFMDWIEKFLASDKTSDVRHKLIATGAPERHAFVGASLTTNGDAFFALAENGRPGLPPRDPNLPPEVTHLWVCTVPSIGRCLAWFPGTGWIDVSDHWATP